LLETIKPAKARALTGVTAVFPHKGDVYREKVPAASFVMNG